MTLNAEALVLKSLEHDEPEEYVNLLSKGDPFIQCPSIGRNGRLAVTRYDAAKKILMDREHFSSQEVARNMLEDLTPDIRLKMSIVEDWLLYSDTERKKEIKSNLMKAMNREFLHNFHNRIENYIEQTFIDLDPRSINVIQELAMPVPLVAMCEFMQIPLSDKDMLKQMTADLLLLAEPSLTDEIQSKLIGSWTQSFDYFRDIIKEKSRNPDSGLISALTKIRINDKPLEDDEIINQSMSLLLGAYETTINLICNTVKHVVNGYGVSEMTEPKLYVDEILRFDPPSKLTARVAKKSCIIDNYTIDEGQRILILFGSPNRDETKFEKATQFNPNRAPNPYLSFGVGDHFCLGANIAKGQSTVFLTHFLKFIKDKNLSIRDLSYKPSVVFRTMSKFTIGEA